MLNPFGGGTNAPLWMILQKLDQFRIEMLADNRINDCTHNDNQTQHIKEPEEHEHTPCNSRDSVACSGIDELQKGADQGKDQNDGNGSGCGARKEPSEGFFHIRRDPVKKIK